MVAKKVPLRKCVVTQERLPKMELLRVVRISDNEVIVDVSSKVNGRGAYIKKDINVLELAMKNKALERALECKIDEDVYKRIKTIIENGK